MTTTLTNWRARTVAHPDQAAWLADRHNGIGASEGASIIGRSHFRDATPFARWDAKVNGATTAQTFPMRCGQLAEDMVLTLWGDAHPGLRVEAAQYEITRHAEFPLLFATRDALVYDSETLLYGLDAKFLSPRARFGKHDDGTPIWGDYGTDQIPDDYLIQGLLSCEIFNLPEWHFGVLWGDKDTEDERLPEYIVKRDEELTSVLMAQLLEWYFAFVVSKTMPPVDGSESATKVLRRLYPRVERCEIEATGAAHEAALMSLDARRAVKLAKERQLLADNRLRAITGDAEGIAGVCTYRQNKSGSKSDWKAAFLEIARSADLERLASTHTTTKPGARVLRLTYKGGQG